MDLATLIGLVGTISAIMTAILMGGSMDIFVNGPGLMIVCAGTMTVVLMKYPLSVAADAMMLRLLQVLFQYGDDFNALT